MIIARTHHETYDYQGVQVVDICRWLREQYDCGGSQGYKSEFNEVSDMWNELYNAAVKVQNGRRISPFIDAGGVAAAILTKQGNIYVGVCIDTACTLGMCAERNAIANMITNGENQIDKVVAVMPDGRVGSPCGACREYMMQLDKNSGEIEILLDLETKKTVRLKELVPDWWGYDRFREQSNKFRFGELRKSEFVMVDNMEWFNVFGLIFIAVIMIPNVVFAIKCKDGFDNKWNNKYVEVTEQVGRLGCFGFMIINIPGTWFGWWSDEAFALYLIVDTILVMLYCAIWIICFKKNSVFRALALSIIPSMLFLFSGIMSRSVLLIIASVLFAPSHIVISYKNVK